MIEVQVNEQRHQCLPGTTLALLLEQLGYQCERVAVAINNEFVPRSEYYNLQLHGSEWIDVVAPVQGG